MISKIIFVFKRFAWFKRLNAKVTYELLAKNVPAKDWQFMNYGYNPNANETPIKHPDSVSQPFPLQMYHYLASKVTLKGKTVLEIGSGRGGGAKHIASFFEPASYIGLDLAQNAVELANEIHKLSNLKFVQGSAEALPFDDNSFDVVVNVESCHAYGSVDKFLSEVKRVLRPGGYLLLVDFRGDNKMTILQSQLKECGLKMVTEENISSNVIESIEAENTVKVQRIERLFPKRWQKLFGEFAGVVGSKFHVTLKNGTRQYYRFVLQKNY
jgi:SAM-dependent methyltransferase